MGDRLYGSLITALDDLEGSWDLENGVRPEVARGRLDYALAPIDVYTARQAARASERHARRTAFATWALVAVTVVLIVATVLLGLRHAG